MDLADETDPRLTRAASTSAGLADADGNPEASDLLLCGGVLFVAVDRVDQDAGLVPNEPQARLAAVDLASGAVHDVDPQTPGAQGLALLGAWARQFRLDPADPTGRTALVLTTGLERVDLSSGTSAWAVSEARLQAAGLTDYRQPQALRPRARRRRRLPRPPTAADFAELATVPRRARPRRAAGRARGRPAIGRAEPRGRRRHPLVRRPRPTGPRACAHGTCARIRPRRCPGAPLGARPRPVRGRGDPVRAMPADRERSSPAPSWTRPRADPDRRLDAAAATRGRNAARAALDCPRCRAASLSFSPCLLVQVRPRPRARSATRPRGGSSRRRSSPTRSRALGPAAQARVVGVSALADDLRYSGVAGVWPPATPRRALTSEGLLALEPDLAIIASFTSPEVRELLASHGVRLLEFTRFTGFADYRAHVRRLAAVVEDPPAGERLLADLDARLARLAARRPATLAGCDQLGRRSRRGRRHQLRRHRRGGRPSEPGQREGLEGHVLWPWS